MLRGCNAERKRGVFREGRNAPCAGEPWVARKRERKRRAMTAEMEKREIRLPDNQKV